MGGAVVGGTVVGGTVVVVAGAVGAGVVVALPVSVVVTGTDDDGISVGVASGGAVASFVGSFDACVRVVSVAVAGAAGMAVALLPPHAARSTMQQPMRKSGVVRDRGMENLRRGTTAPEAIILHI